MPFSRTCPRLIGRCVCRACTKRQGEIADNARYGTCSRALKARTIETAAIKQTKGLVHNTPHAPEVAPAGKASARLVQEGPSARDSLGRQHHNCPIRSAYIRFLPPQFCPRSLALAEHNSESRIHQLRESTLKSAHPESAKHCIPEEDSGGVCGVGEASISFKQPSTGVRGHK